MSDEATDDPWLATDVALDAWSRRSAREDADLPEAAVDESVSLREITSETVRAICRLAVAEGQTSFVAPNAVSLAEALFEPHAWYRAIVVGERPVGFVMLYVDQEKPIYYLWRLMIGADHQRKGYGRAALGAVVDWVRSQPGATELLVGWVPGAGGPEPFYRGFGFEPTGESHDGEVEGRFRLDPPA